MTPHEDAWLRRILDAKAARRAHIDQLCRTHNRCAWCAEAPVDPGQPLCLRCEHFVSLDEMEPLP